MNKPEVRSGKMHAPVTKSARMTKEELARHIKKMRDRDAELVTGIFKNLEAPSSKGGRGSLCFGFKAYKNDEYEFYELWDGERYTISRGVARHLNNNCYYKEYQHLPGEFGDQGIRGAQGGGDGKLKSNVMQMAKKVHRFAFHSLEYMDDDIEMTPSGLVEVTVSP